MQLFKSMLSLALLAGSALAQGVQILSPGPGSTLTVGENFTVALFMNDYIQNEDTVAIVIGLAPCYGGTCFPSSDYVGNVLYQGSFNPIPGQVQYANYTFMVPESFTPGNASLNVIDFFLTGASYAPNVQYLNNNVTVVAAA